MGSCELSRDLLFNCEYKPVSGAIDNVTILEFENIATLEYNVTNRMIVEALTQKATTRAYSYIGNGSLLKPSKTMVKDETGVKFNHSLPIVIELNTPEAKDEILRLSGKKVIAIVKNLYQGDATGKSVYEIYGLQSPLSLKTCEAVDGASRYSCLFEQEDGMGSPTLPHSLFLTSLTVTEAIVDALLVASS